MPSASTYEQHVFGLELNDKFLGPLAKSVALLEKNAAAFDKFAARMSGGSFDKAAGRVQQLINKYSELERVVSRIQQKQSSGGGMGRMGRGPGMSDHDSRRKYEIWWDSQIKKQDAAAARAAQRAEAAAAKEQQRNLRSLSERYGFRLTHPKSSGEHDEGGSGGGAFGMSMFGGGAGMAKTAGFLGVVGLALAGIKKAVEVTVDVMKIGAHYGWEMAKALTEAAKERGLVMTAFEIQLGSREKATKQLNKTIDIAQLTPSSNMQVIDLTKRLLTGGFSGRRLDLARAAYADVQAAHGTARAENLSYWLMKTGSMGEASNSAVNRVGAYINARFIREEMAKQLGSKVGYKAGGPYTDAIDRAVREALTDKQVSSGMFETATYNALLRSLKQKELGAYAKKKGVESLAGVMSNIEEAVPSFLMRLDIDEFAGIKELKRFLGDILSFFTLGTKEGQQLAKIVEDLTNELLGGLKNITRDDMSRFFYKAADAARILLKVIKDAWGVVDQLLHGDPSGVLSSMASVLVGVGKFIGIGIWEGFKEAAFGGPKKGVTDMKQLRATMQQQGVAESTTKLLTEGVTTNYEAYQRRGNETLGGYLGPYREDAGPYAAPAAGSLPAGAPEGAIPLPKYGEGGVVPGPRGKPRLAIVHGGEVYHGVGNTGSGSGNIYVDQLTIQCDESALRKNFREWLLDEINDAAAEGA